MKLYAPNVSSKILCNTKFHDHIVGYDYFFTIERDKWIFTDSLKDSEVVPISLLQYTNDSNLLNSLSEDQIALIWIFETCNGGHTPDHVRGMIKNLNSFKKHKRTIIVHTNLVDNTDPQYIPNDIMFNREKLYFVDFDDSMCLHKFWTSGFSKSTYSLSTIDKPFRNSNKIFLAPNRVCYPQISTEWDFQGIKFQLQKFLHSINANMHVSDPANGIVLETNDWHTNPKIKEVGWEGGGLFSPLSDFYYQTSYVTVCVETIYGSNRVFYPTEKYFDHLIKGNFPLIFSSCGTIDFLKKHYGFKFPDWIDYSYDTIEREEDRFVAYLESIKKLSQLPLIKLHKLYIRDRHILEHNRNIFFTRPYDSLYDKVKDSIKTLGWDKNELVV